MKCAGLTSGRLAFTEKWRIQVAARKVARAQDQGSSETAGSGAVTAPDRAELCRRSGDGFGLPEGRRNGGVEKGRCRRLGRRPIVEGGGPLPGDTPKPGPSTRAGLRRDSPGVANQ